MKTEKELRAELGLDEYLALFASDLPLIERRGFEPLAREAGEAHFSELRALSAMAADGRIDAHAALAAARGLPSLDSLLPHLEAGSLDAHHAFTLGRFVEEDRGVRAHEHAFPLDGRLARACEEVRRVLQERTLDGYSRLRLEAPALALQERVTRIESDFKAAVRELEAQVVGRTDLKVVYPFPRVVPNELRAWPGIRDCELLRVIPGEGHSRVELRLTEGLEALRREAEEIGQRLDGMASDALRALNRALEPCFAAFREYYLERKERVFRLLLVEVASRERLCLPAFRALAEPPGCRFDGLRLPALQRRCQAARARYVPLDLSLGQGAGVLYGANMAGKTTVLKTLYFALAAIRLGLPVPAASAELSYPEEVSLFLRTDGSVRAGRSGFAAELEFLAREPLPGAYVLVDELFLSTHPVGGAELSRIFLAQQASRASVFVCSSHFPEVLDVPGVDLFRMRDEEGECAFRPEPVRSGDLAAARADALQPLRLALGSGLPEAIKAGIRERLRLIERRE